MIERNIDFVVLSRKAVSEFVTDRAYLHISVRDPGSKPVKTPENPNQIARLDLEFSDFDLSMHKSLADNPNMFAFSDNDAKSILSVFKLTEKYINLVVVNCEVGISRSSAIAAALAKLLGYDDSKYFKRFLPNFYVYRKIVEIGMKQGDCDGK